MKKCYGLSYNVIGNGLGQKAGKMKSWESPREGQMRIKNCHLDSWVELSLGASLWNDKRWVVTVLNNRLNFWLTPVTHWLSPNACADFPKQHQKLVWIELVIGNKSWEWKGNSNPELYENLNYETLWVWGGEFYNPGAVGQRVLGWWVPMRI